MWRQQTLPSFCIIMKKNSQTVKREISRLFPMNYNSPVNTTPCLSSNQHIKTNLQSKQRLKRAIVFDPSLDKCAVIIISAFCAIPRWYLINTSLHDYKKKKYMKKPSTRSIQSQKIFHCNQNKFAKIPKTLELDASKARKSVCRCLL